jgi:hypothetical protein
MTFRVLPFSDLMDLEDFYKEAEARGFENNASRHMIYGCFAKEKQAQTWVLFYNDEPVGTVAAHSFDDVMGPNSYRIAARTCVLTDKLTGMTYGTGLRGISVITKHQNPTAQFLIPACIEWAPSDAKLYITSNENEAGTQRRVHNIFGPALQKLRVMTPVKDVFYRGTNQTVWHFDQHKFYEQLEQFGRWT